MKRYNPQLHDLIIAGRATPGVIVSHEIDLADAADAYSRFDDREDGWTRAARLLDADPSERAYGGRHREKVSRDSDPSRSFPMSVQDELDRFIDDGHRRALRFGDDYSELWTALGCAVRAGKQLRPALVLSSYAAYGGTESDPVAKVAAAVELLHTALVIHDDVIDGDDARHGEPNVSGRFAITAATRGAQPIARSTLALTAGVLAGDLALAGAVRTIALCGADADTVGRLLDLIDDALHVSAAGELADVVMSTCGPADSSVDDVLAMEECKTAIYSFQLPLQAGAVLAGASTDVVDGLGAVGRLAGIGYQLVDDLRGVFADEAVTGKSALGDLREGKQTALIAHARQTPYWPEIAVYVGDPHLDERRAEAARILLARSGSRAFVEDLAESHLNAALRSAEELRLRPSLIADLSRLTDTILRSSV